MITIKQITLKKLIGFKSLIACYQKRNILLFSFLLCFIGNTALIAQQSLLNTISGTIQRANGTPLMGVNVQLSGDVTASTQTDVNGAYSFPDIAASSSVTVSPSFGTDDCRSDCIDLSDYLLIQAHIASNPTLVSPYDVLAADVNNDGNVTALDYFTLYQFILQEIPFNNLCWRYLPADFDLGTGSNYPEETRISNISNDVTANFIGIQIGDINACQDNIGDNFLQLNIASRNVSCAEVPATISVPITTNNYANIRGLQCGFEWDTNQLIYTGISNINLPNLSLNNFSTGNTNNGNLGLSWPANAPQTVADGTTLFEIQFNVIGTTSNTISIGNTPLQQKVVDGNFSVSSPIIQNGMVNLIGCDSTNTDSTGMICDNGVLDFDGIDDYVQILSPLSGNANFTFETWVKTTETDNDFRRFFGLGGNNTRFEVGTDDGRLKFFYFPASKDVSGSFIADGQWHHIAIVKNGINVEIFIDGISNISVNDASGFDFTTSIRLGRWTGSGTTGLWHGQMDEVRLWNGAKSISDIIATQNCQLEGNEQGLLFYYDFNQGLGEGNNPTETTLIDRSSPQINGELRNFSLSGETSNWICSELAIAAECVCEPAFTYQLTDSCGTVQFMNQSTGTNLVYLWNFGDGNTSTLENPTHTYTTDGNYQVTLIISDGQNCDHSTQQNVSIVIDNENPLIACLNGLSIDLGNAGSVSINANDLLQSLTDNCGIDTVYSAPTFLNCSHLGTTAIIITALDINGNMSSCTTSVQVTDGNSVCTPQEPFYAYGLSHEPTGQVTFNTGDYLEVLNPDDSGMQGFDIPLGEVGGHSISMHIPTIDKISTSASFAIDYYGNLNGVDNVLLYTERHELVEMDGEKYFMVKLDNQEEEPITYCIVGTSQTLYHDSETGETYYFYQPVDSDKEIALTLSFLDDKSSVLYSENPLRVIPMDLNSGEVVETSQIMVLKGNTTASHITMAKLRFMNLPYAKITKEEIILFEDKLSNQALGETPYNGATLSASQDGNLLTLTNLKDVEKDGLEINLSEFDDYIRGDDAIIDWVFLELTVDWVLLELNEMDNFKLAVGATGILNGSETKELSRVLIEKNPNGSGYALHPDYSGLGIDIVQIDILQDDEVQSSVDYIQGQSLALVTENLPTGTNLALDGDGRIIQYINYSAPVEFQLNGLTVRGNRIQFSYNQDPGLISYPIMTITAQNIEQIAITNEELQRFPQPNEVTFALSSTTGNCKEEACIDLTVSDFQNIASTDFTVHFDPNALTYITTTNNNTLFTGVSNTNGNLRVQFTSSDVQNGATLSDGSLFATFCFEVAATSPQTSLLHITGGTNSQPLIFDNNQNNLNLVSQIGSIAIENCDNPDPIFKCGDLIVTCEPGGSGLSVGLYHLADIANAPQNTDWGTTPPQIAAYHGPANSWNSSNLGHVFGIAIDDINGNFYVTASSVYDQSSFSNPNHGGIYRVNGNDGSINNILNLPNQATSLPSIPFLQVYPELGNICFDRDNQQLFVTNLEDGKIYRLDLNGNILSYFDPIIPDDNTAGFAPLGERLWGIGYFNQAIYYSVWTEDRARPSNNQNSIRKVDLTNGDFNTTSDQHLFEIPDRVVLKSNGINDTLSYASPVSDIAFSQEGSRMLIAQRSMNGDIKPASASTGQWAHASTVLEYQLQSGTWIPQNIDKFVVGSNTIATGSNGNSANSSGGVDWGFSDFDTQTMESENCDEKIWATGDALHTNFGNNGPDSDFIYGLMAFPESGGNKTNSILIDLDGQTANSGGEAYKTEIGDVEVWQCGDCEKETQTKCDSIQIASASIMNETDTCCHTLTLDNQVIDCFSFVNLVPQNGVQISSINAQNGWSVQGFNTGSFALLQPPNNFIPVGTGQDFVDICLTQYTTSQQQVVVEYWGSAPNFEVVCTDTLHFNCPPPAPDPKCIKIINDTVACLPNGDFQLDFDIMTNPLIGFSVTSFSLNAPVGITFTPKDFVLTTPLPPGGMTNNGTFTTTINGANPSDLLKFSLTAHDVDITNPDPNNPENCCTDSTNLACIQLPELCDPCMDISAVLNIIPPISDVDTSCCFTIDLTNNYDPNLFTSIETEILTSGIHFGAICNIPPVSGWTMQHTAPYSNTNVKWTPFGSTFVGTNTTIPKLCLNGIDMITEVPQEIEIRWMVGDSIACRDTVRSECPPPVHYACAQLRDTSIICNDDGTYTFQFSVQNNSAVNTTDIELTNVSPVSSINPVLFPVPIPANGGISTLQNTTITGIPGTQVCFIINLHEINNNGHGNCCADSLVCITLPPCNTDCIPEIVCPTDTCINLMVGETGVIVAYPLPVDTNNCEVEIVCNPPSGSFFECGSTFVICTVTDIPTGNQSVCEFEVLVKCLPDPPMIDTCAFVNNETPDCVNEVMTKTFSTTISPDQNATDFNLLEAAIQNQNNEYVGLGLLNRVANEHDLYFVKTDDKGTVLPDPKKLLFTNLGPLDFSLNTTVEGNTHFFKELVVSGNPDGYVLGATFIQNGLKGGLVARLDEDGCVIWAKKLAQLPTEDIYIRGIVQNSAEDLVCLVQRNSLTANMSMIEIGIGGGICQRTDYQNVGGASFFQPTGFTPVNGLPNTAAQYAICGTHQGGGIKNIGVYLLDGNYQSFNNAFFVYDVGNTNVNTNLTPSAIIQDGNDLVMSGYRTSGFELVGFMQKITPFDVNGGSDGNSKWFYEYEVANTVAANNEFDLLFDLVKTPNNKLVTTGFHADGNNQESAILFQVDANGIPEWAYQYKETNFGYSSARNLALANDNGFILSGSKHTDDAINAPSQFWMAKTDPDGLLRDCACIDTTCVTAALVNPTLTIEEWSGINEMCANTDLQSTCMTLPAIQDFCDQYCPPDTMICEIKFICPQDFRADCCSMVDLPIIEVTDSCGLDTIICTRADGLPLDAAFPNGTTCISCLLQDSNQHTLDTCGYCVTVMDAPPTIICPNDTLITLTAPCQYTVPDLSNWVTVSDECEKELDLVLTAGLLASFTYQPNGQFHAWGGNNFEKLGLNTTSLQPQSNPVLSTYLSNQNIIAVSGDAFHSAAVDGNGTLYTWGRNGAGRTGLGLLTGNTSIPTAVAGGNWEKVFCGTGNTYAIKTDGSLWATGAGINSAAGTSTFVPVLPGATWKTIANKGGTVGLQNNGTIWFLDANPTQIGTDNDWEVLSAEFSNSIYYAIKQNGTLWTWTSSNIQPQQIGTATDWIQVAAGNDFVHAVKANGTLWGWGEARLLGDGIGVNSTLIYPTPTQLGADNDWTNHISSAGDHTIAAKADGSIYTWGLNTAGQIGNGNTLFQSTPYQVFPSSGNINSGAITITQNPPIGTILLPGSHDVTIIATDECGNTDSCMVLVNLECDTMMNMLCDSLIAEVIKDNSQTNSCCYDLIINHTNTTQSIAGIQISTPTPTTITSVMPLINGWTVDNSDPTKPILFPPNNTLPVGGLGAVAKICTDDYVNIPHEVCIEWMAQGREGLEQVCKDTVLFDCDTIPLPPMDTCCINEGDFLKRAANININPVYSNCEITVTASGLDTCDLIWWNWGDGGLDEGPYMNGTTLSHTYTLDGSYTVCYTIAEQGPSGDTCWSFTQCLPQMVDCSIPPECVCGGFDDITFGQPDVFVQPTKLACGRPAKEIGCPPTNTIYELVGTNFCNGDCKMNNINWVLRKEGTPVANGSNDLDNAASGFLFQINSNLFSQPGNYSITLTGDCGVDSCPCIIEFIVPENCGQSECTCGNFRTLQLHNGDGSITDLDCADQITYNLKCPTENRYIYFDYTCPEEECAYTKVATYKITNQSTNEMITGTVNLNVVPNSPSFPLPIIPLPAAFFENSGLYTVTITTYCGDKECVCELEFVSQCPNECTCDDLFEDWYTDTPNDWDQDGFGFPDIIDWVSGCQLNLQSRKMESCDKLNWNLKDLTANTTQIEVSTGSNTTSFSIVSGHSYELTVNITRFADDGTTCSLSYKSTNILYCGGAQGLVCNSDLVTNPSFANDLDGWKTVSGNPTFEAEGGSDGNGYVLLSGSNIRKDAIGQTLPFNPQANTYYKVSLDVNPISVLPGTKLVVSSYETLPDGTLCDDNCEVIGQIIFDDQGDEDWPPQDPMFTKYMFNSIVFHIENDYPDGGELDLGAKIGIDNICIEPVEDDFTCPDNNLQNGGFSKGAIMGNLSQNGRIDSWTLAFGEPELVENSATGNTYLKLTADNDGQDAIMQRIELNTDKIYKLSTIVIDWDAGELGCGAPFITVVASKDPLTSNICLDGCETIGTIVPIMEPGIGDIGYEFEAWKPSTNYNYLTIIVDRLGNNLEDFGILLLDNLCLQSSSSTGNVGCCQNDSLNLDLVSQGFNFQKLGCNLQVTPKNLDSCMQVTWDWGDGSITGPIGAQQSATHTYTISSNATICMQVAIIENNDTCFTAEHCETLTFDCEPIECCVGFSDFSFTDGTNILAQGNCGDAIVISNCEVGGDQFVMTGQFACLSDCPTGPITYQITNLTTGNNTTGITTPTNSSFEIPLGVEGLSQPGVYEISLIGTCGPDSCTTCTIGYSLKDCRDACCIDQEVFLDQINQGFSVVKTCEHITVKPNGLDDCAFVTWRWGDNTTTSTIGNSESTHPYIINGVTQMEFEVCMEVYRFDDQGNICQENLKCELITIDNCCSCEDVDISFDVTFDCGVATVTPIGVYDDCDELKWNWGDGTELSETIGTATATHTYQEKAPFIIAMTVFRNADGQSCARTTSKSITVECLSTSLEEIVNNEQIYIFPNPTKAQLSIQLEQPLKKGTRIRLFNLWGQTIHNQTISNKLLQHNIDVTTYVAGIYFIEIQEENFIYRQKIVKQ